MGASKLAEFLASVEGVSPKPAAAASAASSAAAAQSSAPRAAPARKESKRESLKAAAEPEAVPEPTPQPEELVPSVTGKERRKSTVAERARELADRVAAAGSTPEAPEPVKPAVRRKSLVPKVEPEPLAEPSPAPAKAAAPSRKSAPKMAHAPAPAEPAPEERAPEEPAPVRSKMSRTSVPKLAAAFEPEHAKAAAPAPHAGTAPSRKSVSKKAHAAPEHASKAAEPAPAPAPVPHTAAAPSRKSVPKKLVAARPEHPAKAAAPAPVPAPAHMSLPKKAWPPAHVAEPDKAAAPEPAAAPVKAAAVAAATAPPRWSAPKPQPAHAHAQAPAKAAPEPAKAALATQSRTSVPKAAAPLARAGSAPALSKAIQHEQPAEEDGGDGPSDKRRTSGITQRLEEMSRALKRGASGASGAPKRISGRVTMGWSYRGSDPGASAPVSGHHGAPRKLSAAAAH